MAKYEYIIDYILSLKAGTKISVRTIANELNVSEGTAYKAIKDCSNNGYVSAIPRIGSVRVDKIEKKAVNSVTFADIVGVLEGNILAGWNGIHKAFKKSLIGAMTIEAMDEYVSEGDLLITGNREDVYELAIGKGAGIIISGGFQCSNAIKKLADEKELPIISSKYDTFTIATIVNKIISDNLIKKDIILVEDIMKSEYFYLNCNEKIENAIQIAESKNIEMFPIVDDDNKVVGMADRKELYKSRNGKDPISKASNKKFTCVTKKTTISYLVHIMGREDIFPVIENKKLIGIVRREDLIRTLESNTKNFSNSETIEENIREHFTSYYENGELTLLGTIVPEMIGDFGSASYGVLSLIFTIAGMDLIKNVDIINASIDNITTYFMKPVEIDMVIKVISRIIDINTNFCKVEVEIFDEGKKNILAKAFISLKIIKN